MSSANTIDAVNVYKSVLFDCKCEEFFISPVFTRHFIFREFSSFVCLSIKQLKPLHDQDGNELGCQL